MTKDPDALRRQIEALQDRVSRRGGALLRISASLDFDTVLREIVDSVRATTLINSPMWFSALPRCRYIASSAPADISPAGSDVIGQKERGKSSPVRSTRIRTTRRPRDHEPARYSSSSSQLQVPRRSLSSRRSSASDASASISRDGQTLQHRVVADPGDEVRAPGLERRHQRLARIPGVEAHQRLLAQMPLRPVQDLGDELEPAVGRMHPPVAEPGVHEIARRAHRGDQRMMDPGVVVAVPLAARLPAVDLDRQAVDVDDEPLRQAAPVHRPQPPPREPGQPRAEHAHVPLPRQRRDQPRQRGLRRQRPPPAQRRRARPVAHGKPEGRVVAEHGRVVVVPAALRDQKHRRAQQAGQRVADPARQPPHDSAAAQHFAARDRSRIPRDPLVAGLHPDRPVEARSPNHYLHPGVMAGECCVMLLTH